MTEQTKAQRLADWIDNADCNFYGESSIWFDSKLAEKVYEAADELRRLDALVDELMEALQFVVRGVPDTWEGVKKAHEVIAKAKEMTNEL